MLKPYGFLVIHDATSIVSNRLKEIIDWGYKLVDYFSLPEDVWWTDYYEPLETQVKELYREYENNSEALQTLRKYQKEIDMIKGNPKEHNSAFYILQKS